MTTPDRPRFFPDEPLPPYGFVPGRFPHPVSDPAGHSFGKASALSAPLDPERFGECREYLHAIDLFNHGYYWEAHEAWEQLWHAAGRDGPTAWLLQGLIKLAAAGVKVREGRASGTDSHANGARQLFERAKEQLGEATHAGLRFADLLAYSDVARTCATDRPDSHSEATVVFPFVLHPRAEFAT
jgi:uncharacterized protein